MGALGIVGRKKLKEELIENVVNVKETIAERAEAKRDECADVSKNMGERMGELDYKAIQIVIGPLQELDSEKMLVLVCCLLP